MYLDPKYHKLYCTKNLSDNLLPRCPLLEKIFNDTAYSFDDIYYPPNFNKPPQPKSHKEYKVVTIRQLINILEWWVKENVADDKLICFYAYSYGPCKLRAIAASGINNLITEFNYSHPKIAAEIKNLSNNLVNKAIEWDKLARAKQKSQNWIDPYYLNPVEVKDAANALLYKLKHIGGLVQAYDGKQQEIKSQGNAGQGSIKSKEQAWEENNPDYMSNSDAIANFTNSKMTLSALSKLLVPDGSIRYMRKGRRCKVHIGDFREYAKGRYVPDALANEIADEVLANREAQQEMERERKRRTGK